MDFFIEAGKSLNDKDRNNNNDLSEIQAFFEPIDNLFGDYEIRKKYGLEKNLYRKNIDGSEIEISRENINNNRGKLLYFIILDSFNGYIVQSFWVNPEDLLNDSNSDQKSEFRSYYEISKRKAIEIQMGPFFKLFNKPRNTTEINILNYINKLPSSIQESLLFPFKGLIVLDPIKLVQAADLDEARIISIKRNLITKCFNDDRNLHKSDNSVLQPYFDAIDMIKTKFKKLKITEVNPKIDEIEMESFANSVISELKEKEPSFLKEKSGIEEVRHENITPNDVKALVEEFNANTPLTKLKNFERFEHVRIRLGQYKSGKLVLFLHPYESESNNPIRIPAED